jgi:hypothetical protein
MRPNASFLPVLFFSFAIVGCGSGVASTVVSGDGGSDSGGGGDGGCHSEADCNGGAPYFETCARVEEPQCGGIGRPDLCAVDSDCADAGANKVCVHGACGGSECQARCVGDQSCTSNPPGALACSQTTGQCVAKACAQDSDCPANYACGTSHTCTVKQCTSDAQCSGACVNNQCSSAIGVCRQPAA